MILLQYADRMQWMWGDRQEGQDSNKVLQQPGYQEEAEWACRVTRSGQREELQHPEATFKGILVFSESQLLLNYVIKHLHRV